MPRRHAGDRLPERDSPHLQGGRHLRYPAKTPVTNLFLTVLDKVGVPVDTLGDSTGRLEPLSGV